MHEFTFLTDLAFERLGGRAVLANDEFFAPKENLLKPGRGTYVPDRYTDRGKWMDGWETRRRRVSGHDWCVIRLAVPGVIGGVNVDTNHFKGNHPEAVSIDACHADDGVGLDDLARDDRWTAILARQPLQGHAENLFAIDDGSVWSHVRLNIHPDGGVARLRVYGEPRPVWTPGPPGGADLAAALNGGRVVTCNDHFFGQPGNMLLPGPPLNMGDGWETRRRRGPGNDWCLIRLGCRGVPQTIEVDTTHFKGNAPTSFSLEAIDGTGTDGIELVAMPLEPDHVHRFDVAAGRRTPCTHVRLCIYPDGGVARLRVLGRPVEP